MSNTSSENPLDNLPPSVHVRKLLAEALTRVPGIVAEFSKLPKLYEQGEGVGMVEDDSHLG